MPEQVDFEEIYSITKNNIEMFDDLFMEEQYEYIENNPYEVFNMLNYLIYHFKFDKK